MKSLRSKILLAAVLLHVSIVSAAGLELLEVPIASYRVEFNSGGGLFVSTNLSFILDDGNLWIGRMYCKRGVVDIQPDLCQGAFVNQFVSAVDAAIRSGEKVRICFARSSTTPDHNVPSHEGAFYGDLYGLSYRGYWVLPADKNMPLNNYVEQPCYKWLRGH